MARWTCLFLLLSFASAHNATSNGVPSPTQLPLTSQLPGRVGWTGSPNTRGTFDIIWSCATTMFLCSWTILYLNVYSPTDTWLSILRRKAWITALCFLGPEFILQIAGCQWNSAHTALRQFKEAGYENWTMHHSFFADMGGFVLDVPDFPPFPVDALQLLCLIQTGIVSMPKLDKRHIADRNKVDGKFRIITVAQTAWFCVNIAGRQALHLSITCLELTTAAFIVCNVATVMFWMYKPADVSTAEILELQGSHKIEEIVLKATAWANERSPLKVDKSSQPSSHSRSQACYHRTPLDFVSRKEWHWSLFWSNWINILRNFHIPFINFTPKSIPVDRFGNTLVPSKPPRIIYFFLLLLSTAYSSIFVTAWNYEFPTPLEQILWRAASLTMLGSVVAYWAVSGWGLTVYPKLRNKFSLLFFGHPSEAIPESSTRRWVGGPWIYQKAHRVAASVRNNSRSRDPLLTVPLKVMLPIYCTGFMYCVARTYILVSDILELRSLPASAYDTVSWTAFLPHFG